MRPPAEGTPWRVCRRCLELCQPREEMRIALASPFLLLRELTLKPADRPGSLVMGSALLFKEQSSEGLRSGSESR